MKAFKHILENGSIDAQSFADDANHQLIILKEAFEEILTSSAGELFSASLKHAIAGISDIDERQVVRNIWQQIINLPNFIEEWRGETVDSASRFDFFVTSKAHELASGDLERDYYAALSMRFDQISALIVVLSALLTHLKRFLSMPISKVLEDSTFLGLINYSVEDQIALEAEKIAALRKQPVNPVLV